MKTYEKIIAWQLAHRLTKDIYTTTSKFPKEEMYGLVSQLRRAAISIAANIVEGRARGSTKEFLRFLLISRGSLEEVEYLLYAAHDLHFIDHKGYSTLSRQTGELSAVLNGLIVSIRKKLNHLNTR